MRDRDFPPSLRTGLGRRDLLRAGLGVLSAGALDLLLGSRPARALQLPFERGDRPLAAFPEKRPLLVMTTRPPQLETPFPVFDEGVFTPNDAFFVRWHLAGIPTSIDPTTFRLRVRGRVRQPLSLSLAELQRDFEQVEVAAVCQCAGNSRGLFEPRVPGGQWGNGAMGNALWKGVRLRDLLRRAQVRPDAVRVRFDGLDGPVARQTPDFTKSLPIEEVMADQVLVAHRMNGAPLPFLNGFPLRLVVPGWFATYWIKMLSDVEVLDRPDEGFWMTSAYRVPADPCRCESPDDRAGSTDPIGRMAVRSFITHPTEGQALAPGRPATVRGFAFDQGYGIDRVLLSVDGGRHWARTELGPDHGPFSFRAWQASFRPDPARAYALQSLAINRIGDAQPASPRWNRGGYLRNVVETVTVRTAGEGAP